MLALVTVQYESSVHELRDVNEGPMRGEEWCLQQKEMCMTPHVIRFVMCVAHASPGDARSPPSCSPEVSDGKSTSLSHQSNQQQSIGFEPILTVNKVVGCRGGSPVATYCMISQVGWSYLCWYRWEYGSGKLGSSADQEVASWLSRRWRV